MKRWVPCHSPTDSEWQSIFCLGRVNHQCPEPRLEGPGNYVRFCHYVWSPTICIFYLSLQVWYVSIVRRADFMDSKTSGKFIFTGEFKFRVLTDIYIHIFYNIWGDCFFVESNSNRISCRFSIIFDVTYIYPLFPYHTFLDWGGVKLPLNL